MQDELTRRQLLLLQLQEEAHTQAEHFQEARAAFVAQVKACLAVHPEWRLWCQSVLVAQLSLTAALGCALQVVKELQEAPLGWGELWREARRQAALSRVERARTNLEDLQYLAIDLYARLFEELAGFPLELPALPPHVAPSAHSYYAALSRVSP